MEFIRPRKPGLALDMAPLIDIVFQLLIFFMLSSSFLSPAMKLDLPRAASADPKTAEFVVVSLDREGNVFVNTQKSAMSLLKDRIQESLVKSERKAVHVRGDKEMPYKYFVEVMDKARQAGARQINIVHESEGSK